MSDGHSRGAMYGIASAVLFGASTPLAKLLLDSVSPLALAALLYLGAGVGLGLVLLLRRRDPAAPRALLQRESWPWLAGATLSGGVLGPIAMMHGLAATSASVAALLLNLEAVFTALVAWRAFGEHIDRRIALGMAAIVAGGLVLAWSPLRTDGRWFGPALVALACLCWAIDNNLTRRIATDDAVAIAMVKGLVAGVVTLALARSLGSALPVPGAALAAAAVGFAGYGASLALYIVSLRRVGAARAGAYFAVAPFVGAVLGLPLGESPPLAQLALSGALMAAGVWLHVTERHAHEHRHDPLEHSHAHVHDLHHRHDHAFTWDGREPHVHPHVHAPMVHAHAHFPDAHHRHPHR